MTATPRPRPAPASPATAARHLDTIAAALERGGTSCRITRPGGTAVLTPVLTTGPPQGPAAATVAINPDMHAGPDLRLDCTCVWTPPPGATAQATAAVITAVLAAARTGPAPPCRRPSPADAARLATFLDRHPGWSAYWDKRYRLWRAAEDDPDSGLYAEDPDPDAIIAYITNCT